METELKLRWDHRRRQGRAKPLDLIDDEWLQGFLMTSSCREIQMSSRYFDTPEGTLTANLCSLRVREEDERRFITLKIGPRAEGSLHQRQEWTSELEERDEHDFSREPEAGLDVAWFLRDSFSDGDPDDELRDLLKEIDGKPLQEICSAEFTRTACDCGYGGTLLELCVDIGELAAGQLKEPIEELEVELMEGDVQDLIAFGQELVDRFNLVPESHSKYARGLRLLARQGHPIGQEHA